MKTSIILEKQFLGICHETAEFIRPTVAHKSDGCVLADHLYPYRHLQTKSSRKVWGLSI